MIFGLREREIFMCRVSVYGVGKIMLVKSGYAGYRS